MKLYCDFVDQSKKKKNGIEFDTALVSYTIRSQLRYFIEIFDFLHFSAIFKVGIWKRLVTEQFPGNLEEEKERLRWFCLKSKSENTVKNYKSSFNNFCKWCKSYNLTSLPASDVSIALYLSSLARVSNSESKINLALYSISWAHKLEGFTDPCSSNLVVSVKEGVLRSIGKPLCMKEPISGGNIAKIISHFGYSNLLDMCFATMSVISFAGFLCFNEVVKLKRHDVKIDDQQAKLIVHSSKMDQYSKGQHVIIARTGEKYMPH